MYVCVRVSRELGNCPGVTLRAEPTDGGGVLVDGVLNGRDVCGDDNNLLASYQLKLANCQQ